MSQDINNDVQVEVQKTLALINDITLKIKTELSAISDLVRENGRLNIAVDNANAVLSAELRDMNITGEPRNEADSIGDSDNYLIPVTPDFVTEKLMSIIGGENDS